MKYIRLEDEQYPISLYDIRLANKNVSMVRSPTDENLLSLGYASVIETAKPVSTPSLNYIEVDPTESGAVWIQTWFGVPTTPEEQERTLEGSKASKNSTLASDFNNLVSTLTIVPSAGFDDTYWVGDQKGLLTMKNSIDYVLLKESKKQNPDPNPDVKYRDADGKQEKVPLDDAETILLELSATYDIEQDNLFVKQAEVNAITIAGSGDIDQALADVDAITL